MVFYIIAAAEKETMQDPENPTVVKYKTDEAVIHKIKQIRAFQDNRPGATELHRVKVSAQHQTMLIDRWTRPSSRLVLSTS